MPRFDTLTLATTDQLSGGASPLTLDAQTVVGDGNSQDLPLNLNGFTPAPGSGRCVIEGIVYVRQPMGSDIGTASLINAMAQYNPIGAWSGLVSYFMGQFVNNDGRTFRANIADPNAGLPAGPTVASHAGWDDMGPAVAGEWQQTRAGLIDVQTYGGLAPYFLNNEAFPTLGESGLLLTISTTVENGQTVEVNFRGTIKDFGA